MSGERGHANGQSVSSGTSSGDLNGFVPIRQRTRQTVLGLGPCAQQHCMLRHTKFKAASYPEYTRTYGTRVRHILPAGAKSVGALWCILLVSCVRLQEVPVMRKGNSAEWV